jgi:predicted transcriptional regulator
MSTSVAEYLERDLECEDLLECIHGLKQLDRRCYELLVTSEDPLTVDEVAEELERERSTAYRSVQRLLDAGLVEQRQVNYEGGGYHHVYTPADPDEVAARMQRLLNDWYAHLGQLIHAFQEKYADTAGEAGGPGGPALDGPADPTSASGDG